MLVAKGRRVWQQQRCEAKARRLRRVCNAFRSTLRFEGRSFSLAFLKFAATRTPDRCYVSLSSARRSCIGCLFVVGSILAGGFTT